MNLIWHIARKDLRRFWIPLALLSLVAALRFGVGVALLLTNGADPDWFEHLSTYANVLWGICLVVTYLLVAAVVQEDSPAGPAFWQTRPISGSRLLTAKVLGLTLMFGVLPVLLAIPWWFGCGFGLSDVFGAALEMLAVQLGVVLLALPWAVVTGNYGRFLLWTLVAAVAVTTGIILFAGHTIDFNGSGRGSSPEAFATRLGAIGLLATLGCSAVAVHQFATRCTWRSIVLIAVSALSMTAAAIWWPWDLHALWAPRPTPPTGLAKDVSLSFESASASVEFSSPGSTTIAEIGMHVGSIPSHYILSPTYSEQALLWPDGTVNRQAGYDMWWGPRMNLGPAYDALGIARESRDQTWSRYMMRHNLSRTVDWDPKSESRVLEYFPLMLSLETLRRLRNEKPEFDGVYWFRLLQPDVLGEKELRVEAEFHKDSNATRLASLATDEAKQILRLSLVERSPGYIPRELLWSMQLARLKDEPVYGVVNQNRTFTSEGLNETRNRAVIDGVSIVLRKDTFWGRKKWNSTSHLWEMQPDSFTGATLVAVDFPAVQQFSLPLRIDHFSVHLNSTYTATTVTAARYSVTGAVNKPGDFEMVAGANLINALRAAGGVTDQGDLTSVKLTHTNKGGSSSQAVVNVEAWLEGATSAEKIPVIEAGDVVDVPVEKGGEAH